MDEPADNSRGRTSSTSSLPTGEGIVIDIGTGDGTFVYESALRNPKKFFIGIDASARPLEKISEKIHRSPRKGGAPNALFLEAAVERLPDELYGVADEVYVQFPWGSLLSAVILPDAEVLRAIRRICAPGAALGVVVSIDPRRDAGEMNRLGIGPISVEHIDRVLAPRYRVAGFEIRERAQLDRWNSSNLLSSWARRLSASSGRVVHAWMADAIETPSS